MRNVYAVLDQALYAGSHFLLNLLLARWLAPADYGAFAVGYACLLLALTLHTAFVTEPMMVLASGRYLNTQPAYLRRVAQGSWVWAAIVAVGFGAVCLALSPWLASSVRDALLAAAVALPFASAMWMVRRVALVRDRLRSAVWCGGGYALALAVGAAALLAADALTATSAMLLLALAVLPVLWMARRLASPGDLICSRLPLPLAGEGRGEGQFDPADTTPFTAGDLLRAHWHYGRWAVLAAVASWLPVQGLLLLLPVVADLETTGTVRAWYNLMLPLMHVSGALAAAALPVLARSADGGEFAPAVRRQVLAGMIGAAGYGALLVIGGAAALRALYAEAYAAPDLALWLLAALGVMTTAVSLLGTALRAQNKPQALLGGYVLAAIAMLAFAPWLASVAGATGGIAALVLAYAGTAVLLWRQLSRA